MDEIRAAFKRQGQLDVLLYVFALCLIAAVLILGYAVFTGLDVRDMLVLDGPFAPPLLVGLLLAFLLYVADQRKNLGEAVRDRDAAREAARIRLQQSVERLQFAQHVAEVMTTLPHADGLKQVLRESAERFKADAAALVGDDLTLFAADHADEEAAAGDILSIATRCVATGEPFSVALGTSSVIGVPLRVRGTLRCVCCLWGRNGELEPEAVEGLRLVCTMMEIAMENEMLAGDIMAQRRTVVRSLASLGESCACWHSRHNVRVADLATAVGHRLGLDAMQTDELSTAALLHDIGMLELPPHVQSGRDLTPAELAARRGHVDRGVDLVAAFGLGQEVQEAIAAHHEHYNGSGYPNATCGSEIPLFARIITACDRWDTMGSESHPALDTEDRLRVLEREAGLALDPLVSDTLRAVLLERREPSSEPSIAIPLASSI